MGKETRQNSRRITPYMLNIVVFINAIGLVC